MMAQATSISWTDLSWNPVHGCSKVSPGCAHCYAATISQRYGQTTKPWTPANAAENVLLKPHKLREPLSGAKAWQGLGAAAAAAGKTDGKLVFVNSMSDLFHEQVPDDFIARVFSVMANAPQHTFQVLTKRPERMAQWVRRLTWSHPLETGAGWRAGLLPDDHWSQEDEPATPLPNVWLGTSIENRRFIHRWQALRRTPAAVRFISAEPLLGPLVYDSDFGYVTDGMDEIPEHLLGDPYEPCWLDGADRPELDLTGIDWLIVGGESGPHARPMDPRWVRDLRGVAQLCDTAFFFKQDSGPRPGQRGRFADLLEWPQEFPQVRA